MKIKRYLLFTAIIFPFILFSQENKKEKRKKADGYSSATQTWKNTSEEKYKGNISGKVKSTKNKKALEFATISLSKKENNKLIEGTITNNKGKFLFENISVGKYEITVSFIGFKDTTINIETSKSDPDIYIKNISLNSDSEMLSEVVVEEDKAIYETRIDKIVYNAENDLNDTENDATDVLRKAPLLSVDLEGNVSLRGSRNIKFLVNGKASTFFSSDVSSALQMIPADEIKSIEVITTPGSKYDGDGDAGIVNIITKRKRIDGYQSTIRTGIGSKTTTGGLNLNLGKGRWGLSVNGGTWGSGFNKRVGEDTYNRLDWNEQGDTNRLMKEGISESFFNGYRGSINTYYDINAYNYFNSSFSFSGRTKPYNKTETSYYTTLLNSSEEETDTTISTVEKTDRTMNLEWTTDYTKKFKNNEDRELSLAFQLGGNINDGNTNIYESTDQDWLNQNDEKVIEETFQIDYTHPFGSKKNTDIKESQRGPSYGGRKGGRKGESSNLSGGNKIEIGGKIINRNREIVYSDMQGGSYINAEEFNYSQLVSASYLSTEFNLPKGIGIKAGIRFENTQTQGDWKNNLDSAFQKDYNNLLPNIILSKSFSPMQSIKLSYNQRITRPSVRQINTNTDKSDNTNISIGNPQLDPTITEKYELSVNSFGRILQGSFQLYHKHSSNIIESFLEIDSTGNSISRYKNIGESRQTGFGFFGSINLKKFSFRTGLNIYNYSGRDARLGYTEWTDPVILYSYNFSGNYSFAEYWKAETFAFYRSPTQSIQGSITSFSMMSIGIKRVFKNKRGSIGIRLIEPFRKNKEFTTNLSGDFFTQESVRTIPFRSLSISFKYTLGKLNFKDGSKKTNIKNDDIQQDNNDY